MKPITKYHGLGNDFLLVDERDFLGEDYAKLAQTHCDRHTGIGADGFILVRQNPLTMIFYNADGSKAPMCGNGIRCFAKYCVDEKIVNKNTFTVQTPAGEKQIVVQSKDPFTARVHMGRPDFDPKAIAVNEGEPVWGYPLGVDGKTLYIHSFFMNTVHTVVFVQNRDDIFDMELGQKICHHPFFKEQTNVNFVYAIDKNTIEMRTYERGVGPTLACGTGACAAAVAAKRKGLCGELVTVRLPKGQLMITVTDDEEVYMSGPAALIMKGAIDDENTRIHCGAGDALLPG